MKASRHTTSSGSGRRLLRLLPVLLPALLISGPLLHHPRRHPLPHTAALHNALANNDVKLRVEDFDTEMTTNDNAGKTLIKGSRAVVFENDIYQIESPEVVLTVEQEPEADGEEQPEPLIITLTARKAELDKRNQRIRMSESVEAIGPDFELHTESIRFDARDRRLVSNEHVEMNHYELNDDEQQGKWLSLNVRGRGLVVELPMQRVTIGEDSTTTIYRVTEYFLASETQGGDDATGDDHHNVTIQAEGNMVYSHLLQKIDYHDNVTVRTHDRKLHADKLEISIDREEETDRVEITGIEATGNIQFTFEGWIATGERLGWQNFTQIGKIQGSPAQLTAGDIEITGNEMDFYRLRNRLRVNGPGELTWETQEDHETAPVNGAAPFAASGKPVRIEWEGNMVYTEDGKKGDARFEKQVNVRQDDSRLECEILELAFETEKMQVVSLHARNDVRYVQGEQRIKARELLWDMAGERITMSTTGDDQWVVITEPGREMKARRMDFNLENNTLHCPGEGRMILDAKNAHKDHMPSSPLRIQWSEDMDWDGAGKATFRGAVQSAQNGRELDTDRLDVFFDDEMNPLKLQASGGALLTVTDAPPFQAWAAEGDDHETGSAGSHDGQTTDNGPDDATIKTGEKQSTDDADSAENIRWQVRAEQLEGLLEEEIMQSPSAGALTIIRKGPPDDTIQWTDRMTIDMQELYAVFEGDVEAVFSETTLQCGKLRVDLDEGRRLRYLNATRDVSLVSAGEQGWELSAGKASAVFAPGGELDHLIARTGVRVTDAERRLRAEQLRLFFAFDPATRKNALRRATAREEVMIWYEEEAGRLHARGDSLQWNRSDDTYEIEGKPAALRRDGVAIEGELIRIDRTSGRVALPEGASPAKTTIENR